MVAAIVQCRSTQNISKLLAMALPEERRITITKEEAIRILETGTEMPDFPHTNNELNQALSLAVSALQAQQIFDGIEFDQIKTENPDRNRWKGCAFCKQRFYTKRMQYLRSATAPLTEVDKLRDRLIDLTGEVYVEIENKFCPYCGRPLTEEAWAELERRLKN